MLNLLDSGFRLSACDAQAGRNDEKWRFLTFYECVKGLVEELSVLWSKLQNELLSFAIFLEDLEKEEE